MSKEQKNTKRPSVFSMGKGYDMWLQLAVVILAFVGIVIIGSASMGTAVGNMQLLILNIAKQCIFVSIGYFLMAWISRKFKLSQLHGNGFQILIIIEIMSLLLCRAFPEVKGAYNWIRIPLGFTEVTIQPSEFAKILIILIVAAHLGDRRNSKKSFGQLVGRAAAIFAIMASIILLVQKDFGSMMVLMIIACVCYLIPRNKTMRKTQVFLMVMFYLAVFASFFLLSPAGEEFIMKLSFLKPYQKQRFISAIDPFRDPYGNGYQIISSLIAFAEGGLGGKGLGRSVQKYMNLPEAGTDFILAVFVGETGWIGFCLLMLIYGTIIYRLLYFAYKMKSEAGRIILVGTSTYFLVHLFFNIGGVTGLIPLTGIPLPLMSAGGSSAVAFMMAIGLSQAVIGAYKRKEIQ